MFRRTMMTASISRSTAVAVGLVFMLGFAGQSWGQSFTTTEQGLLGGGVLGAGTGAIVGAAVHHPIKGTLIGGGVGAVAGGVVGHALQTRDERQSRLEREVSVQGRQIERQRREIEELRQTAETE
jgi:outer membrane protein with glycine zipper